MEAQKIYEIVQDITGKSEEVLKSNDRHYKTNYARYYIISILNEMGKDEEEIAEIIGRHRTSVIHGLGRHQDLLPYDDYSEKYKKIKGAIELSSPNIYDKLKKELIDQLDSIQWKINNLKCEIRKL